MSKRRSKRRPHHLLVMSLIEEYARSVYLIGLIRDLLRMGKPALLMNRTYSQRGRSAFCGEVRSVLRIALAAVTVCSMQEPRDISQRYRTLAPTFRRAWLLDGVSNIMCGPTMLS